MALLAVMLAASACGFQPLYRTAELGPDILAELAAMRIAPRDDRVGQLVRNNLLDLVTPLGEPAAPRYLLTVTISERREGVAIARDASVTRFNLTLAATYELQDLRTRTEAARGAARATASYNVLRSEFANVIAERDAETRAARVIAEEIKGRLSIQLARGPGI